MKIKRSPWLRFYHCPECGAAAEKADLRDPTGPCPTCGYDRLGFKVARWRIEIIELSLLGDLLAIFGIIHYPDPIFTAEFREQQP